MNVSLNPAALNAATDLNKPRLKSEHEKAVDSAKDFESLLVGQMLQSFREAGSSWLGGGDDDASGTAFSMGEQQLAKSITNGGGFGLAKMIQSSLEKQNAAPSTDLSSSSPSSSSSSLSPQK